MIWNSDLYSHKHSFVYQFGEAMIELLDPEPGEHILDLGCGNGHLTSLIRNKGAEVAGIDASKEMIAAAKSAFPLIDFNVLDACQMQYKNQFNAIFSNAVLHWIPNQKLLASKIFDALKPGGRFVAEFGGKNCNASLLQALRQSFNDLGFQDRATIDFWYFPTIAQHAQVLEEAGFSVSFAQLFPRPTELQGEDGMRNWFKMFGDKFFYGLSEEEISAVLSHTESLLRETRYQEGKWIADYVRIRIIGIKSW